MNRRLLPVFLAPVLVLGLGACTQSTPGGTPLVEILSPSGGEYLNAYEPVLLSAIALDLEDGNISADLAWESSLDGELSPDTDGLVMLAPGSHVLTASVTDSSGASASDSVTVTVEAPAATHLVSSGRTLRMIGSFHGQVATIAMAEVPGEGPGSGHQVYNAVFHPVSGELYVASFEAADWGNARIDRFEVGEDTLTYVGAAFVYEADLTGINCTFSHSTGIVGECAPIGMAFSPDGTRLYVDDDYDDVVQVFAVEADGSLTFVTEGASTSAHGLTIDATGTYLYNGTNVVEVTADAPTTVFSGDGGNSTGLVDLGGTPGLITTIGTDAFGVFDLTDPEGPALVADEAVDTNQARELAHDSALERIFTVGERSVMSFSFDGAAIEPLDAFAVEGGPAIQYRGVDFLEDTAELYVPWFASMSGQRVGGLDVFSVGPAGELEREQRVEFHEGAGHVIVPLPRD